MTKSEYPGDSKENITLEDVERLAGRESLTDSWRVRDEEIAEGEHADELVGQVVAGRYDIKGLLGRGGMGAVYLAEHVELKKPVALKVLHRYMTSKEEVVARFEREAVAAGRLAHPSIVAATDFGRIEDGSFYLALEFIHGKSLADVVAEKGKLEAQHALSIAYQITDALCAAHDAEIVHRDLKPDNVLLVDVEGDHDLVKVVDFGIAKVSLDEDHEEGITRAGLVFGTPEYMSPEQAMGHPADARSDLYGVGMLLYEMLCGRSPFRATDVTAMLTAQITEAPPPLSDDVPERLANLVMWLLEKSPEDRPESAHELLDEITVVTNSLALSLPPPRTKGGRKGSRQPSTGASRSGKASAARKSKQRRSRRFPWWVPVGGLFVGATVGVLAMLSNEEVVVPPEVQEERELIDAEAQLISEAGSGDRDAIAELRKLAAAKQKDLEEAGIIASPRPPADEGEPEDAGESKDGSEESPVVKKAGSEAAEAVSEQANRYFVLGRGYSIIKHYPAAIDMYREAVRLDPYLSEEPELLLDVRVAIAARDAVEDGLDFALHSLGAHGADIIYDVYLDHLGQAGMTPVVARAMHIAQSEELMEQATPALKVALQLRRAKLCGEYRDIIPEAVQHADDRSLQTLRALRPRRGCGTYGNKDCFICLRKDDIDLEGAIKRAETHASPSFLTPAEVKSEKKN